VGSWLNDDEQAAWRSYVLATSSVARRLDRALKPHGLSTEDYGILAVLSESPDGELRLGELARALQLPKPFLSYRFQRLEQAGLVERRQCPNDARGVFGVLTDRGLQTVHDVAPVHVDSVRRVLLDNLTPSQISQLGTIMTAVLDGINDDACPDEECAGS